MLPKNAIKAGVYTIPPFVPFLPELAHFIFEQAEKIGGLHTLPTFKILLPSRRAVRALQFSLQNEWVNRTGTSSLLMPHCMPIGDVDDEDLDLSLLSLTGGASNVLNLPPVISPIDRRLWLADLIQKKDPNLSNAQCLDFAKSLARLMDQVHTENLNLADIKTLVKDRELSLHWQQTVEFLDILGTAWPAILAEQNVMESSDRRNKLLTLLADHWRQHPPVAPIIAAGSTGSIPAVANLLKTISHLPAGHVVLPALDINTPDEIWSELPPSHPQANMKSLIELIGIQKNNVTILNHKNSMQASESLCRDIMLPSSSFLNHGTLLAESIPEALKKLHVITATQEREEAQYIALILREIAENPRKTACVITPDRNMARRIAAELKRWNINVNDSAGQGLHTQNIAVFLNKILSMAAGDRSLDSFLSLLRSPYLAVRVSSNNIFEFEQKFIRQAKFKPNMIDADMLDIIAHEFPAFTTLIQSFKTILSWNDKPQTLRDHIAFYCDMMNELSGGENNIWNNDAGDAMALYLQNCAAANVGARVVTAAESQAIIEHFLSETMVRDTSAPHPNITILGQIEARLLKADVMILAGLNEGTWPQDPEIDPWMSRPMRGDFGLPSTERHYALSAHDFMVGFCSSETYLVRSERMNGAPTIPARWLQRLEAYLKHNQIDPKILSVRQTEFLKPVLDTWYYADNIIRLKPPSPQPPAHKRPHDFYVTDIEKLINNPYHLYAQSILRIRPLSEIITDDDPIADAGNILHAIFEHYGRDTMGGVPDDAEMVLKAAAESVKQKMPEISSSFWQFFWQRFERMIPSFVELDKEWRQDCKIFELESKAACELSLDSQKISLRAKADRIDSWGAQGIAILDYKSGKPPTNAEILDGRKPQLPLELLMATEGAYNGTKYPPEKIKAAFFCAPDKVIDEFEIRSLDKIKSLDKTAMVVRVREEFLQLIERFLNPSTPLKVTLPKKRMFADEAKIHHLARSAEWGILQEDADGEDAHDE